MNAESVRAEESADAAVGRRVHMLMWDRQVTQTALAPRLGIEQSALSKKLRGQRGWSVGELIATAAFLQTTVSYLVGESGEEAQMVHPLGLEPRTHCFRDGHLAPVVEIGSARSLSVPFIGGGEAA